jgi:hypothetical protein
VLAHVTDKTPSREDDASSFDAVQAALRFAQAGAASAL